MLKTELQMVDWAIKWSEAESKQHLQMARAQGRRQQEERKSQAAELSREAQQELEEIGSILKTTLAVDDRVEWESLKGRQPFGEARPTRAHPPLEPAFPTLPGEPLSIDWPYRPTFGLLDRIIPSFKQRLLKEKADLFDADHSAWRAKVGAIKDAYNKALQNRESKIAEDTRTYDADVKAWLQRKEVFENAQAAEHAAVDAKKSAYEAKDPQAVVEYMDLVLSRSKYPGCFPHEFDIEYDEAGKTAVIDYQLPSPDEVPRLKSVKYVLALDQLEEQFIGEPQAARQYDDALYQTVLRTVHELFESDVVGALEIVVVNGFVTSVDRKTGKPVTACVLSLRASKAEFVEINLAQVDPKACFKALRGVGSSKLHGLAPVAPIMLLTRDDRRFVSAYEVANTLDSTVNLAAMDWEDFEHLIREVFEKEFSSTGGEVKVTQASRDGGVDAVAFDPDPIRGGKIVIQAKRYTNTVGVSAVRDLYGTVLNEGATKGVLVTTSDYGPDSYAFAAGKPLVLLSGANLLHMLEKHGHKACINLNEAKKLVTKSELR